MWYTQLSNECNRWSFHNVDTKAHRKPVYLSINRESVQYNKLMFVFSSFCERFEMILWSKFLKVWRLWCSSSKSAQKSSKIRLLRNLILCLRNIKYIACRQTLHEPNLFSFYVCRA